ncbi:target of SBF [Pleosporales sp. CAS-2024a]
MLQVRGWSSPDEEVIAFRWSNQRVVDNATRDYALLESSAVSLSTTSPRFVFVTDPGMTMDNSPSRQAPQSLVESTEAQAEPAPKPCLLPAFGDETTFSSSPFPRPSSKRKFDNDDSPTFPKQVLRYFPTPVPSVPTSSTILPSSSPRNGLLAMQRTVSALSERAPLGAVPTVDLPFDGEIVRMGRSSNASDYQLSTNRLISRVHVQAAYHASTAKYSHGYIEIECLGWNGAKIHCGGRVFELSKGDTYMSENPDTEIMLDVQDTRVMIAWPTIPTPKLSWGSEEEDMPTPTRCRVKETFDSSPPVIPRSPVSQSPIRQPVFAGLTHTQSGPVLVFEDADANGGITKIESPDSVEHASIRPPHPRFGSCQEVDGRDVKSSMLSSFADDDFSDADEENDPIVHSFGPYGQNILGGLASFSTAAPIQSKTPRLRAPLLSPSPKRPSVEPFRFQESPIKNHVINQLAFSRIHSQPLSAIHSNLPADLKASVTKKKDNKDSDGSGASTPLPQLSRQDLKRILDETPCIGEIPRAGKDAAGQPLENEFYYVPEMDTNQMRRETITAGTRSTGLRSVRKTHKQYYWKKPRV